MIKFEMKQPEFIDTIKKMAIPVKSKKKFIFPIIVLTIRPNEIEWMGKSEHIITWVQAKCTTQDILNPIQVPIDVPKIVKWLNTFKNKDIISLTHDLNKGKNILTEEIIGTEDSRSVEMYIPDISIPDTSAPDKLASKSTLLDDFPFRLDKEDPDMILFNNGLIRPNISCTCDVNIFQDLVKSTVLNKKIESRNLHNKTLLNKIKDRHLLYNIYIDSDKNQLKTIICNEHNVNYVRINGQSETISGCGELHYSSGFADVVNLLSGVIKFFAVDNGPLWITQNTDKMKIRYLIAPAPIHKY